MTLKIIIGKLNLQNFKIRIEAPPRRRHMVFSGGAVLAHLMRDRDDVRIYIKEVT